MKKSVKFLSFLLLFVMVVCCVPVSALTDVTHFGKQDSLKILAIGNSFSEDATEYIPLIARDMGIKNIVVGNMYIGGCTIATHAANAKANKADYKYYKNTSFSMMSVGPSTKNVSLETALKDEKWDIITLQHSSVHSGQASKYGNDLEYMLDYVKNLCPEAKIGWHMTWAYETGYDGSSFKTYYSGNEVKMYNMITDCVKKFIVPNEKIDFIIPAGTAIQNARSGWLGDHLTRDGLHLTLDYGRYIVGATWFKAMGFDLDNLKTMPSRVKKTVLPFIKDTVNDAFGEMFAVTQSKYWYEPGKTPPATQAPETQAVTTVPETASQTAASVTVQNTESATVNNGQAALPDGNNTVLILVSAVAVVAVIAVVAVVIIRKKKK